MMCRQSTVRVKVLYELLTILLCRQGNMWNRSQVLCRVWLGCFPTWMTFLDAALLNFQFDSWLVQFFKAPSWIWKTIPSISLQTIAHFLSRLVIDYRSYDRASQLLLARNLYSMHGCRFQSHENSCFLNLLIFYASVKSWETQERNKINCFPRES